LNAIQALSQLSYSPTRRNHITQSRALRQAPDGVRRLPIGFFLLKR